MTLGIALCRGQDLDLMIIVGVFQIRIIYDSRVPENKDNWNICSF